MDESRDTGNIDVSDDSLTQVKNSKCGIELQSQSQSQSQTPCETVSEEDAMVSKQLLKEEKKEEKKKEPIEKMTIQSTTFFPSLPKVHHKSFMKKTANNQTNEPPGNPDDIDPVQSFIHHDNS